MRKSFRAVLIGAVLTGVLAVSAGAADYTGCAQHLESLGLFQGTEQGYELDRVPTRAEAAVMLVRLLGAEQDALALEYTAPFADLDAWQQPYVQYLYDNGLTIGVAETAFAPEETCSAQMYAAFALRALGYSETAGDYPYAQAVAYAQQLGLYDPAVVDTAVFLRDDAVAASYTALSLPVKDSGEMLLDRLVSSGAVDVETAKPYQALFDNYAKYREVTAGLTARTQFSVHSSLTAAFSGGVKLSSEEDMTVDPAHETVSVAGVLTMETADIAPYTQTYHLDTAELSEVATLAMLHGYDAVPLAWVETLGHTGSEWTFSFRELPARYKGLFWVLSHTGGVYEQADAATLVQTVQRGTLTAQTLTAVLEQGGTTAQVELTGTITNG